MESPSQERPRRVTRFAYDPPVLLTGPEAVATLGTELEDAGLDRALVVCNRSVGAAVRDPLMAALEGRLVGVFDEASGQKRLQTAWQAAREAEAAEADTIVGLGAGSALDIATVAGALYGTDRAYDEVLATFAETGTVPVASDPPALVTVPTTLAGAELSHGAGITAMSPTDTETTISGGVRDIRLQPTVTVHDATLVSQTPVGVLRGSAMNGFDKGIEAVYSPAATPVTDATATTGIARLYEWLPRLGSNAPTVGALEAILEGMLLVQYGTSRPDATTLSIIHAFGHGVTAVADVQQGVAHGVCAPHVLSALFDRADCRRSVLADALGVETADEVVAAVVTLRDALDLPNRLGDLDAIDASMLERIAAVTAADRLMANQPPGVTFDRADIDAVLEAAW